MAKALRWKCNPGPQREFVLGNLGKVREILYGGAKGGGKSEAIGPKVLLHVSEHPKWARVLILREDFPQLTELIDRMRPLCLAMGGKWNEQRKTWTFPEGAKIRFGHLRDGCDPYWGHEYSLIVIDEVTRCIASEADYLKLLGSLRNSHGVPCQVIALTNPGGRGHNWVKARFMGVPPRTIYKEPETGLERVFIPASLSDTPQLPPEYRRQLELLPEAERKAFLDGDWSAFEGNVFRLEPTVHVWTWAQFNARYNLPASNRKMPAEWTRFRSMDWGFAAPFAIYWYAVDYEGRMFAYREWYGCAKDGNGAIVPNKGLGLVAEKVAEKIAQIEKDAGESDVMGVADPAIWSKGQGDHGGGPSIQEKMATQGVYWMKGKNDRISGKNEVHNRLAYERNDQGELSQLPGLILIAEETPHAQRTIPTLEYDEHIVEDVDTTGEDHAYDSVRYGCMSRPWAPALKHEEPAWLKNRRRERSGYIA